MPCEELERLRTVAVRIHQEIATKRARRQEAAQHEQRTSSRGHADMENFLQRRLQRASTAIEQHLSAHKCAP